MSIFNILSIGDIRLIRLIHRMVRRSHTEKYSVRGCAVHMSIVNNYFNIRHSGYVVPVQFIGTYFINFSLYIYHNFGIIGMASLSGYAKRKLNKKEKSKRKNGLDR
jgi:hypothetical protein